MVAFDITSPLFVRVPTEFAKVSKSRVAPMSTVMFEPTPKAPLPPAIPAFKVP